MNDFYKYPDLSSVETINDGIVFYTETKYYGDWFK